MNKHSKTKKIFYTATLLALIFIMGSFIFHFGFIRSEGKTDEPVVIIINRDSVFLDEYKMYMNTNIAMTLDYFFKKYHAVYSGDIWIQNFSGEIPVEMLKTTTTNQIVNDKIKMRIARELGIIKNIRYRDFLECFRNENNRRADATKSGQIIYGPTKFDLHSFYGYYISNLENAIRLKMKQKHASQLNSDKLTKCTKKDAVASETSDEITEQSKEMYVRNLFDDKVKKLVDNAKVQYLSKAYDEIMVDMSE